MKQKYIFSSKKTGKFRKSPTTNKHRIPFSKLVLEIIKSSDIILEILDARFIQKTRNLEMEKIIKSLNKKLIYVLNKSDLAKISEIKREFDFEEIEPYVLFSCVTNIGRKRLREKIKLEVSRLKIKERDAQVGVIGYPNTGKSSLINVLARRKGAGTSPTPGFTKAIQKIRLTKNIVIFDTPGIFPEKENPTINSLILKKHAQIGVNTYNQVKEPEMVVAEIMKNHLGKLERFYNVESDNDSEVLIEKLGRKKNFLRKGNEVDTKRTAKFILKDWQEGKMIYV